jgi:molybdopterin-containing oxidoreductase family iron-sulfur binding subunit
MASDNIKTQEKVYWKGIEELKNDEHFIKNAYNEFAAAPAESDDDNPHSIEKLAASRRDFLKVMGFSVAAASLAACETPVKKAIPWLNKPEDIDPSIANFYASTYAEDGEYCSILVKTREGRPIKIEGNTLSSITRGGTSARVQGSVLSLYDEVRFRTPIAKGKETTWENLDKEVKAALEDVAASGSPIYIVATTIMSPSTKKVIADFRAKYPSAQLVQYDPVSAYGILKANEQSFGVYALPSYDFSKAETVVSFGADFLGTWLSPTEYSAQFAKTRKVSSDKKTMSRLYVVETIMSLTGCNADFRKPIKPSELGLQVAALYNKIAEAKGAAKIPSLDAKPDKVLDNAAKDLLTSAGKSIVVCGSNDVNVQLIVNAINNLLGNYGNTIDMSAPSYVKQGNDQDFITFVNSIKSNSNAAVLFYKANPAYEHPLAADLKAALSKVKLSVSFADRPDETTEVCQYVAPDHHYLESWGDAEPKKGYYSLQQPSITPLFKTRQAQESLLTWAGVAAPNYYEYVKAYWKANIYPKQTIYSSFKQFWNYSLHDGIFEVGRPSYRTAISTTDSTAKAVAANLATIPAFVSFGVQPTINVDVVALGTSISQTYKASSNSIELVVYEKIGMGAGSQANNPWLQEFPDPISRACWDNYLTIPISLANELGIEMKEGQFTKIVNVTVSGKTVAVPALIQPGQAKGTVGIAIGYGRTKAGKVANGVGVDAFPLIRLLNGALSYSISDVKIENTNQDYSIAHVQTHHTVMGRKIVQEATLTAYKADESAGRYHPMIHTANGEKKPTQLSLWSGHVYPNHHWGLVIDLNTCTGCGACVVACQAENNVSVVGKKEVITRREMHWIRIDRYYSSDAEAGDLKGLEQASENPQVVFMPLMCQHCNNAPCETVCPVLATTHSSEGLNQMTYNRCVGTRYCANNCPYKVRRFNWFKYYKNDQFDFNMNNELGRMVLNPDVTVRSRGVMEKCSMCVQRIQEGKLNAKKEKRKVVDGEIQVACAQACPSEAIIFGDMLDPESKIAKSLKIEHEQLKEQNRGDFSVAITEPRAYHVLEEINVRPSVSYLSKIRNNA